MHTFNAILKMILGKTFISLETIRWQTPVKLHSASLRSTLTFYTFKENDNEMQKKISSIK